jgi:chromosome partitioning protein
MKIISFLNSKGGVGKTTLATNLARYLYNLQTAKLQSESYMDVYEDTAKILLVDADPQGSVREWHEAGGQTDIDVIAADTRKTLEGLPHMLKKNPYHYVLIDTPGKVTDIMAASIAISDVCLIPVCPSPYDIWASKDVVTMIKTRQQLALGLPDAFYILNRCIPKTRISFEVLDYIKTETEIPIIGHPITQRVCYAETAKDGATVFDLVQTQAMAEISRLGEQLVYHFEVDNGTKKQA